MSCSPINSSSDLFSGLSPSCALFWWSWYAVTGFRKYAFLHFILCTPKTHALAILLSDSELVWFLICTLLVTLTVAGLVQRVSWPGFNVYSSGDTDCGLSCFRQWVGLVFDVHSSGDTDCGLSCFRKWVGLVFDVHSSGDTDYGLSCFRQWVGLVVMCTLLVILTMACLVQYVSWPGFNVHFSGDTYCGLSCFSMWVGWVFNMHSSGDNGCPVLVCELAWF